MRTFAIYYICDIDRGSSRIARGSKVTTPLSIISGLKGWRQPERGRRGRERGKKQSKREREHSQSMTMTMINMTVVILICPATGCVQQQNHVFILKHHQDKTPVSTESPMSPSESEVSRQNPGSKALQRQAFLFSALHHLRRAMIERILISRPRRKFNLKKQKNTLSR